MARALISGRAATARLQGEAAARLPHARRQRGQEPARPRRQRQRARLQRRRRRALAPAQVHLERACAAQGAQGMGGAPRVHQPLGFSSVMIRQAGPFISPRNGALATVGPTTYDERSSEQGYATVHRAFARSLLRFLFESHGIAQGCGTYGVGVGRPGPPGGVRVPLVGVQRQPVRLVLCICTQHAAGAADEPFAPPQPHRLITM